LLHGESRLAYQVASVVNKTMKGIGSSGNKFLRFYANKRIRE